MNGRSRMLHQGFTWTIQKQYVSLGDDNADYTSGMLKYVIRTLACCKQVAINKWISPQLRRHCFQHDSQQLVLRLCYIRNYQGIWFSDSDIVPPLLIHLESWAKIPRIDEGLLWEVRRRRHPCGVPMQRRQYARQRFPCHHHIQIQYPGNLFAIFGFTSVFPFVVSLWKTWLA